jgi:hypothetical protein
MKRGRHSLAEITVLESGLRQSEELERPKAPRELTAAQAIEWNAVVRRLTPDWFPEETHALLVQYCRQIVHDRELEEMLQAQKARGDSINTENYRRTLRMKMESTKLIITLATKMRITQQSLMDERQRKPKQIRKPWDESK